MGHSLKISLTPEEAAKLALGETVTSLAPAESGLMAFVVGTTNPQETVAEADLYDTMLGVYIPSSNFGSHPLKDALEFGKLVALVRHKRIGNLNETPKRVDELFGKYGMVLVYLANSPPELNDTAFITGQVSNDEIE